MYQGSKVVQELMDFQENWVPQEMMERLGHKECLVYQGLQEILDTLDQMEALGSKASEV